MGFGMSGHQFEAHAAADRAGMISKGTILPACTNTSLKNQDGKTIMSNTGKFIVFSMMKIFCCADS